MRQQQQEDHRGGGNEHGWQESRIQYDFDKEMNGMKLIRDLNSLGQTNDFINKIWTPTIVNDDDENCSSSDNKRKRRWVVELIIMTPTMTL